MKKAITVIFFLVLSALSFSAASLLADEGQKEPKQEKYFEEPSAKPLLSPQVPATQDTYQTKPKRKWRFFGKAGYEYDDNVSLVSNKKSFRRPGDKSAGRYSMESGLGYNVFRSKNYNFDVSYLFGQSFHDDSLNEFNFRKHQLNLLGQRAFKAWGRPSVVSVRYQYAHGDLDNAPFSDFNSWLLAWNSEWKENLPLELYNDISYRNFRYEGYLAPDTSRDGLYNRTGFVQKFLFDKRRREVSAGYEFAFDATDGNRFDNIANGVRVGLKTPVIEKIKFETNFLFQDAFFHHFPSTDSPEVRHDLRYQYEFILSRPLCSYVNLAIFYKRTDVNTLHDGVNGRYNFDRNIYGFELRFKY